MAYGRVRQTLLRGRYGSDYQVTVYTRKSATGCVETHSRAAGFLGYGCVEGTRGRGCRRNRGMGRGRGGGGTTAACLCLLKRVYILIIFL